MAKRRSVGRPKNKVPQVPMVFRLPLTDRLLIEALAEEEGLSGNLWVRRLVLRALGELRAA